MAVEKSIWSDTYIDSGAGLAQYHFCMFNGTDNTVIITSNIAHRPCGVTQEVIAAGAAGEVMIAGKSKIMCEETLVSGDRISTNASGHAIKAEDADTTVYVVGVVVEGAASGELCVANINCSNINCAP